MLSRTTPPLWRRAFLRALGQGATVRLAARHAGIGTRQPYTHRSNDPLFAKLWTEAQKRGREALQAGEALDLPSVAPRTLTIRQSRTGRTKLVAAGEGQWNEEKERQFLDHLAATGNLDASAQVVGISRTSLYRRRRQWPAFCEAWDLAKADAVDRLELLLIETASNLLDPPKVPVRDLIPMTFDQAMRVVERASDANRRGQPKRTGWRRKERDPEEIRASILHKLDVIERHERG